MAGPMYAIASYLLFTVLAGAGLVLLVLGVRGRWRRCEPCCVRCGQIVGMHEVTQSGRCPECGQDLSGADGIRFFSRRRRPVILAIGAVSLILAVVTPWTAAAYLGRRAAPNMPSALTVPELLDQLEASRKGVSTRALDPGVLISELHNRMLTAPLTNDESRRLLAILTAMDRVEAQGRAPFGIGALLDSGHQSGAFSKELLQRLVDAWFPIEQSLQIPPRMRTGVTVPLHSMQGRLFSGLELRVWLLSIESDAGEIQVVSAAPRDGSAIDLETGAAVRFKLEPGSPVIRATLRRELRFSDPRAAPAPSDEAPAFSEQRTIEIPVEVIDMAAPSFVPLRTDPARAREVAAACRVASVAVDPEPNGARFTVLSDASVVAPADMSLCFDIIAVIGGREIPLGWIHSQVTGSGAKMRSSLTIGTVDCTEAVPDKATVRFVPAPRRAEDDPTVEWIWGAPVEIRDVPVRTMLRPSPKAAP